ncbi:hypothetical protein LXA43DRAFT_1148169 [Ganoderma leucocontextum]|nr:hypothetical protein LXA43DRAFT_1148169 [Ganoderma leucocontextum]
MDGPPTRSGADWDLPGVAGCSVGQLAMIFVRYPLGLSPGVTRHSRMGSVYELTSVGRVPIKVASGKDGVVCHGEKPAGGPRYLGSSTVGPSYGGSFGVLILDKILDVRDEFSSGNEIPSIRSLARTSPQRFTGQTFTSITSCAMRRRAATADHPQPSQPSRNCWRPPLRRRRPSWQTCTAAAYRPANIGQPERATGACLGPKPGTRPDRRRYIDAGAIAGRGLT